MGIIFERCGQLIRTELMVDLRVVSSWGNMINLC